MYYSYLVKTVTIKVIKYWYLNIITYLWEFSHCMSCDLFQFMSKLVNLLYNLSFNSIPPYLNARPLLIVCFYTLKMGVLFCRPKICQKWQTWYIKMNKIYSVIVRFILLHHDRLLESFFFNLDFKGRTGLKVDELSNIKMIFVSFHYHIV